MGQGWVSRGSAVVQGWVSRGSGLGQGWVRAGSGSGQGWEAIGRRRRQKASGSRRRQKASGSGHLSHHHHHQLMRQVLVNCGSADQVIFPSVIGTRHAANCTAAASDSLPANIEDDQATSSCTAAASDSLPENPEYGIVDPADTRDEAADFLNLPGRILHDGAGYSTDAITHRQERGRSEPGEGLGATTAAFSSLRATSSSALRTTSASTMISGPEGACRRTSGFAAETPSSDGVRSRASSACAPSLRPHLPCELEGQA